MAAHAFSSKNALVLKSEAFAKDRETGGRERDKERKRILRSSLGNALFRFLSKSSRNREKLSLAKHFH